MSVSSVSSTSAPAPVLSSAPVSSTARAADGDYLAKSAKTSSVKDADGDYKPAAAPSTPAATSSSATQAALLSLKSGG